MNGTQSQNDDTEVIDVGEIRAIDFQRYAIACGDRNPIYFDDEAARKAGYPGIVAPPQYLTSVIAWEAGPLDEELAIDGVKRNRLPPELEGKRGMGGGHDLVFHRAVRPGDKVTAYRRFAGKSEKDSKLGRMTLMVWEIRYEDEHGEPIATCRSTTIFV